MIVSSIRLKSLSIVMSVAVSCVVPVWAQQGAPKLNQLFSEGAVLQREKPVPVWGTAGAGEEVTVKFREQSVTGKASAEGVWQVTLKPEKAGGPDVLTVSGTGGTREVKDVLVGEVWLASGQSNMALQLKRVVAPYAPETIPADPMLRQFGVNQNPNDAPQTEVKGRWVAVTPETAQNMSAVGYFFGTKLRQELGVPVGIILSAVAGTPASSWTSEPGLKKAPAVYDQYVGEQQAAVAKYPEAKAKYDADLAAYNERKKAAEAAGTKFEEKAPKAPGGPDSFKRPFCLFNGMIHPLIPYGIRGVLWYQGEQDSANRRAVVYHDLLRAMIADWRGRWGEEKLPFIIVQLPGFQQDNGWVYLQLAQAQVGEDAGNSLAVTVDLGTKEDVHPLNKKPVGDRVANLALADVYGKKVAAHAPKPGAVTKEGGALKVAFVTDEGVTLVATPEGAPQGFEIAGEDGVFVPAVAKLEGNAVILTSEKVSAPVKVRYAFASWPTLGVFDSNGLPSGPFAVEAK